MLGRDVPKAGGANGDARILAYHPDAPVADLAFDQNARLFFLPFFCRPHLNFSPPPEIS